MYASDQNLESTIIDHTRAKFKSSGERRIANFLDKNCIKYQYEPAVLVNTGDNRPRIWYPDFYLPEFKNYIEYFGMAGNHAYDEGIKRKESVYLKMGLDVLSIYPWMFNENWQGYVMKQLERNIKRQYRTLMEKPYWSQGNSLFDQMKAESHHGYGKRFIKLY